MLVVTSRLPKRNDMTTKEKSSLLPLLAVNFVGTLGFSIVTPFLVVLVANWGGNAVVYGVLAATYSFFQLFGAPILGRWSDRIGRRKVLLLSQAGTLLSWGIFLVAFTLPLVELASINNRFLGDFAITLPLLILFVARAADGLTGGNVSVSNAYLADISSEQNRSKNYGQMAVSSNLGYIVGPAMAGLLGATILGEILPVALAFVISAVALLLIQFGLHEVAPAPINAHVETPSACDVYGHETKRSYQLDCEQVAGTAALFRLPNMKGLMSINFAVLMGFSFFYAAFPIHAVVNLTWSVFEIGIYFAFLSLIMIAVQGPVLAWASGRYAETTLMAVGGVALAAGFLALTSDTPAVIYLSAALIALGNGLMWPTFMSVLSKSAGDRMQGAVQGYATSLGAVASIIGLVGGGIAYVQIGATIFVVAALAILLGAAISLAIKT
ncbi:MAG: DHA1 family tetracycline resistance protein-like MFS transporter [Paracoccaceae bacterium]|jgi:DHA1 family tetracycline resistance protein-like MFS transporter